MRIFRDKLSGDELVGDSFPMKEVDDFLYEFNGKSIEVNTAVDDSCIGGNASAEEAQEGMGDEVQRVIDIVYSHKLVETSFATSGDYIKYLKKYLKALECKLKEESPDRVEPFKTKMTAFIKDVFKPNFKDFQYFIGESCDENGMIILMNYREDGLTPYFIVFKDGVIAEKC